MLGAILAGILKHGELGPLSVLEAVKEELTGDEKPRTLDPIDLIDQQMTEFAESFRIGEDFLLLGESVFDMIGNTARACFYFLYVIAPLWARKSRGLAKSAPE